MAVAVGPHEQSLLAMGRPALTAPSCWPRHQLDALSWIDEAPGWLAGADELLHQLATSLRWRQRTRRMWDREVDEPRMSAGVDLGHDATPPILATMSEALSQRYGRPLDRCFAQLYRDGCDSVAWHADQERHTHRDPIVAIVTLGGPRSFALRPLGGGAAMSFSPASGDLLVMGGATQHRWQHAVPKRRAAPPRLSITFRQSAPIRESARPLNG